MSQVLVKIKIRVNMPTIRRVEHLYIDTKWPETAIIGAFYDLYRLFVLGDLYYIEIKIGSC